jgi:hypothetical protein
VSAVLRAASASIRSTANLDKQNEFTVQLQMFYF